MKTKAVRLYGKHDLRLEEFELPAIADDEVRVKNISDSICMSTYKAQSQGTDHKRVPNDIATNPVMVGHEFCGEIVEIGKKWKDKFQVGERFVIQPAHNYEGSLDAPGYTYPYCGGASTYAIIPRETLIMDCLLPYPNDTYFYGSLAEPMSCIIGTFHAMYHTTQGSYEHKMGIVDGGKMALLASVGPMGLGAIDYALHADLKPSLLIVTDIDDDRLARAASIYTVEEAKKNGVELIYLNTAKSEDPIKEMMNLSGGHGFDDVFVFAPVKQVIEQGDQILAHDGCLNFFAGPSKTDFKAELNFYNVHYATTHIVGTSGGNNEDLREAVEMMAKNRINPAAMITHIGGLDSVIDTTMNLPNIPGGKKLIYPQITMPLTAISDFAEKGINEPLFAELALIVAKHNNLWNSEAEKYLLNYFQI